MTEYLFKIGNALQAAKGEGDDPKVNIRQLARNLADCSKHMEESITRGSPDEARVRQRAVLAALISCSRVREALTNQPGLAPLLKTVPVMPDCTLSMVVRPLSCQNAVFPVLTHLPLDLLSYLIKMELERITKALSPPLFSLVVELLKSLLYVWKTSQCTDDAEQVLGLFESVFKIALHNFDSDVAKNSAFTFLLLLESLYQFSMFILIDKSNELPISYVPELENSFENKTHLQNMNSVSSSVVDTTVSLLKTCHEAALNIDVNTFISWAEVEPTDVTFCSRISRTDTRKTLTVQSLIRYRAFSILRLYDSNNNETILDEVLPIAKALQSALQKHIELYVFLNQIAVNPEYDPDSELAFRDIVSFLQGVTCDTSTSFQQNNDQTSTLTKERIDKLTNLLIQQPNFELFDSSAAADVVSCLAQCLSVQQVGRLLKRYLQHRATEVIVPEWNKTMVQLCRPIPGTKVRQVVLSELHRNGGSCRDWLFTDDYLPYLTSICNTMAHDQEANNNSDMPDDGLWCVAVQRPGATVSALVQQAVSVSGMALVTAKAVRQLAPLCTAHYVDRKLSVLTEALKPFITDIKSFSKPKQRIAFIEFFRSLCELHNSAIPAQDDEPVVLVEEVMRDLLLPTLQWRGVADLDLLEVPVAVMQVMLEQRSECVLRCCLPGSDTVSLLVTLLSLVHNCTCLLAAPPYSSTSTTAASTNEEGLRQNCDEQSNVDGECSNPDPGPSLETVSAPGSSQCLALLSRSRDVLREIVKGISNSGDHQQSALLLRSYLNGNRMPLPVSCVDVLRPLLVDLTEPDNSSDTIPSSASTSAPLQQVSSSRAAVLLRLMSSVSPVDASNTSGSENCDGLLQDAKDWPCEEWIITLVQVLHSAPQEDWIAASSVLEKINFKVSSVSGAPVPALAVLRDVLQLITLSAETGLPVNSSLSYKHCIAAATHLVKQRCSVAPSWRERLLLVTRVFVWWCKNHVSSQDTDLSSLLLLRLADMVREIGIVVVNNSDMSHEVDGLKTAAASKNENSKKLPSDYETGNTDNTKEECVSTTTGSCNNENSQELGNIKKPVVGKSSNTISIIQFRAMVGSLNEPFLKYTSEGNLSQTVATRLVGLFKC